MPRLNGTLWHMPPRCPRCSSTTPPTPPPPPPPQPLAQPLLEPHVRWRRRALRRRRLRLLRQRQPLPARSNPHPSWRPRPPAACPSSGTCRFTPAWPRAGCCWYAACSSKWQPVGWAGRGCAAGARGRERVCQCGVAAAFEAESRLGFWPAGLTLPSVKSQKALGVDLPDGSA